MNAGPWLSQLVGGAGGGDFLADGSVPMTGALSASAGIIAPWIRPAADSTTAVQIGKAAGTSVVNIDTTNGRVGIGTTSPAQKLDVNGQLAINGVQTIYSPGALGTFTGSLLVCDGGGSLSHTTGNDGYYNTAIGYGSLFANTTGYSNTAMGFQALFSNITGNNNSAIGPSALPSNTTGSYNLAIGYAALYINTTGNYNSAIGSQALYGNTIGDYNAAIGNAALYTNTAGDYNSAIGFKALFSNTIGNYNAAIGSQSLYNNTTGNNNSAIGESALYDLGATQTAGSFVTGVSYTIKIAGTTDFTLIGAANSNFGTVFTATGAGSGTGTAWPNGTDDNIAIGHNTGRGIITGTGNTILGANVTGLSATLTNNIILADGEGNRRINVDSTGAVGIGTTSPTAGLDVNSDTLRLRTAKTPASAGASGSAGDLCWDANYLYACVADNTWKRAALTTW